MGVQTQNAQRSMEKIKKFKDLLRRFIQNFSDRLVPESKSTPHPTLLQAEEKRARNPVLLEPAIGRSAG